MLIHVLSDIHLEFAPFEPPSVEADVVVVAGDLTVGEKGLAWLQTHFPSTPVVYVLGNHEYYRHSIPRLRETLQQAAEGSPIHVLENQAVEIQDVIFLGCTLWTDLALAGNAWVADQEIRQQVNDFRLIRVDPQYRRLTPGGTVRWHVQSRAWLSATVQEHQGRKIVVVTHHAPSALSLAPADRRNPISAAFASNLDQLVIDSRAALWIHGHVHTFQDYRLGETRVLCNPRGYPVEHNTGFQGGLVVSL